MARKSTQDTGKTPKRSHIPKHGEGSFRWHEPSGTWRGSIEIGDSALGTRKRIYVSHKDEDIAWDKFQVRRKRLMLEGRAAAKSRSKTVGAWLKEWLEAEQTRVRPKTFNGTRTYVTRWMIPIVGRVQLQDLEASHAKAIVKAMLDDGKSTTYAGTVLGQFQSALRAAIAEGYRVPDSVLLVKKPAKSAHDRRDLPLEDALKVVRHLGRLVDADPRKAGFASRWLAAFLEGMRQGEALGMTWDRVHLDEAYFTISWQLQNLPYNVAYDQTSGFRVPHGHKSQRLWNSFHLVELKSDSGYRLAPMIPVLAKMLEVWKEHCPRSEGNLVWPRATGEPQDMSADRAEWAAIQAELGIWKTPPTIVDGKEVGGQRYVIHEIRHTTASLLLHMRIDPKTIKEVMGHSEIVTTQQYQHVSMELAREAMEAVGQRLQLMGAAPSVEIIPAPMPGVSVDDLLGAFAGLDPADRSIFLARAAVLLAGA